MDNGQVYTAIWIIVIIYFNKGPQSVKYDDRTANTKVNR